MNFNENEYCIEMSAAELCSLVARPSDLDSRVPSKMNLQSKNFDVFLSQLPDYDRAHEPLRLLYDVHNTTQINGNYYTVTTVVDRAYKDGDIGYVDKFIERRFIDESALNYETIFFSAGRIGAQVEVAPKDLIKLISCRCLDLTKGENEND